MNSWLLKSGLVGETTQYDKKILPDFRKPKSWLKSVSAFAYVRIGNQSIRAQAYDLRRNPVIADVFNRMDLMERRGSGFKKIIDAYRNAYLYRDDLLPRMYSNDVDFCVVLRNLNYGIEPDAVNTIENESFTTENESFALTQLLERAKVPNKMREHIVAVYTRAKEEKVFSRKDIMTWLGFSTSSAAGRVINMMKKLDLIEHAEGRGNGKYQFRKEVEGTA